jgi:hypothetical protein
MLMAPAIASPLRVALPLHHLGGNAVQPERAIVGAARHLLAVDQHLCVGRRQAAQLHGVELQHVADECGAGHALDHVARRRGLEALEVVLAVGQRRRDGRRAVAVGDLASDDDDRGRCRLRRGRRLSAGLEGGQSAQGGDGGQCRQRLAEGMAGRQGLRHGGTSGAVWRMSRRLGRRHGGPVTRGTPRLGAGITGAPRLSPSDRRSLP